MIAFLRSSLYALLQLVTTPVFAILGLLLFPLPLAARYRFISTWSRLMLAGAEAILGISS